MTIICIEGMKGAGKTTTINFLVERLKKRGVEVTIVAPFTEANTHFEKVGGVFPLLLKDETVKQGFNYVLNRYLEVIKTASLSKELVLLDRGWITLLCALEDSVLMGKSFCRDSIMEKIPPTLFLNVGPKVTLERRKGELDAKSGLGSESLVERDHERRLQLKKTYQSHIIADWDTTEKLDVESKAFNEQLDCLVEKILSNMSVVNEMLEKSQDAIEMAAKADSKSPTLMRKQ